MKLNFVVLIFRGVLTNLTSLYTLYSYSTIFIAVIFQTFPTSKPENSTHSCHFYRNLIWLQTHLRWVFKLSFADSSNVFNASVIKLVGGVQIVISWDCWQNFNKQSPSIYPAVDSSGVNSRKRLTLALLSIIGEREGGRELWPGMASMLSSSFPLFSRLQFEFQVLISISMLFPSFGVWGLQTWLVSIQF